MPWFTLADKPPCTLAKGIICLYDNRNRNLFQCRLPNRPAFGRQSRLPDAPLNHGNVPPILYKSRKKLNRIHKNSRQTFRCPAFLREHCVPLKSKIILRVGRSVTVSVKVTLLTSYLVCLFVCMFVSPFDQYMDNIENLIACRKKCVFCVKTYRLPVLYRV